MCQLYMVGVMAAAMIVIELVVTRNRSAQSQVSGPSHQRRLLPPHETA